MPKGERLRRNDIVAAAVVFIIIGLIVTANRLIDAYRHNTDYEYSSRCEEVNELRTITDSIELKEKVEKAVRDSIKRHRRLERQKSPQPKRASERSPLDEPISPSR